MSPFTQHIVPYHDAAEAFSEEKVKDMPRVLIDFDTK
jgi:hypothetical protein